MRIAILGNVTLDFFAQDFRRAGHEVYLAPGFDTWRTEIRAPASGLREFSPEAILLIVEGASSPAAADEVRACFPGVRVVAPDLSALADETPNFFDERMRQLAAMPFSLAGIRAIEEEFFFGWNAAPKKILALDADGTLWRGIISEDGVDAVTPYVDFQKGVLELRARGILLVLLTKNEPPADDAPVTLVFARPDLPLTLGDFTVVSADWAPKAGRLLEICHQLNLGTDAVVFVDDNPHERAQMQAHLPEVVVPPFPADLLKPAQFLRRLTEFYFPETPVTDEDRARADQYAAEAARQTARAQSATLDAYLTGLAMRCVAAHATAADIPRLAQMAGKTNQFNATTIRRTADDFAALLDDPAWRIWTFRVTDAFGEMGLVCYVVAHLPEARITDFLMSCRAMGRTIEQFAFNYVRRELAAEGRPRATVDFVPTAKNGPFKRFWENLDWTRSAVTFVKEEMK